MSRWKLTVVVAALLLTSSTTTRTADQTLIAAGSSWKYNDSGTNLGTAWSAPLYSDASWPSGPAQLGYGDGDELTVLSYGTSTSNRRITYYFRRAFTVADPASLSALSVRFVRDDGAVIYLNGVEVSRSNMPTGTVSYTTLATAAIGNADESAWIEAPIDPSLLVAGNNVLAVEIHQQSASSSDISFDLELRAIEARPPLPAVTLTSPAHTGLVNTSPVTFTASVSAPAGLVSATLYAGGPPETAMFTGPSQIQDAQISADTPTTPNGAAAAVNVDGLTPHVHGLIKFPTLIGSGAGRVPANATVTSATLQVTCTNPGNAMRLYRLTEDWVEDQATWNQRATGLAWGSAGADGTGSNAGVAETGDCTSAGQRGMDITRFVQEWSNGAPNYGIVLTDSGTDGIDFSSSESTASPTLTVLFKSSQVPMATQALSGIAADLSFPVDVVSGQTYFWNVQVTDTAGQQSWAPVDFQLTADQTAPDEPVLISPLNEAGAVDPSATLSARVSDPSLDPLTVNVELRRAPAPEFTIIAMPDTQFYSESYPAIFTSQTQWIVDNKEARNIVFVTHEGDIVNQNTTTQWVRANQSLSMLDGVVPYGMGPGNHDQPTTMYNQYFPFTRYQTQEWYGGHYQNLNDNNYQLFSSGGIDFVIVHLEFCPPAGAITWADSVYKLHLDRIGIMTTHGYLNESAQRTVHGCADTQYLWDGLAVPNPNLHFMLSGHVHDESRRVDIANGHPVFQMLADYQGRANGGEGWLRILRLVPAESRIYVQTYSPWLNRFETDANSEFTLDFPMGGAFESVGTTTAPSGSTAFVSADALEHDTRYEWRVTVTNSRGKSRTSPVWTFTTAHDDTVNRSPIAASQSLSVPEDGTVALSLSASDPDQDDLTYSIVNGPAYGTLSGTPPALVYQPAANYNGTDSFSFRANDGAANSNAATVSVTVQPVNDPPIAGVDSYTVQGGTTLSTTAPGVLGNDTDIDSTGLAASVVTGPSNGILALAANGSFTYTPTAGYSGPDAFTYRASDGPATSTPVAVSITVQPAPPPAPLVIFTANFDSNGNSFSYVDNTFRGATQSSYASGSRVSSGGFSGGALRVRLGGENSNTINGMSGGWRRTFTLSAPRTVVLSFRYNLDQGADYESDEYSQMMASVDGGLIGATPLDYVAQVVGNGNGGSAIGTGWQLFQKSLGTLPAGTHTVILGGYNNRKNSSSERTTILIDDVSVTAP
jgi:hypothetical protein